MTSKYVPHDILNAIHGKFIHLSILCFLFYQNRLILKNFNPRITFCVPKFFQRISLDCGNLGTLSAFVLFESEARHVYIYLFNFAIEDHFFFVFILIPNLLCLYEKCGWYLPYECQNIRSIELKCLNRGTRHWVKW